MSQNRIAIFATKGTATNEEHRIRELMSGFEYDLVAFDKKKKLASFFGVINELRRLRPRLIVMEGTGISGGIACIFARLCLGSRFVVSSGDAVGPIVASLAAPLGPPFALYERVLCRMAAGFIGWTPYLVGRALTFGVPRAMTAEGWAPFQRSPLELESARRTVRQALGIAPDAVVFGIAGALVWDRRRKYSYGMELIQARRLARRSDLAVLVVGDGSAAPMLRAAAGDQIGKSVFFTGNVPQAQVPDYLAAMDVGSLPQSCDKVGSFRYTTKISEYLAASIPVVTGQIPLAFDLDDGWLWRLGGNAPWDPAYIAALAGLMERITPEEISAKRARIDKSVALFDRDRQIRRTTAFISGLFPEVARVGPTTMDGT